MKVMLNQLSFFPASMTQWDLERISQDFKYVGEGLTGIFSGHPQCLRAVLEDGRRGQTELQEKSPQDSLPKTWSVFE